MVIKFSPPEYPSPTSLANFGLGEWYSVTTSITLKGGATIGSGKGGAGGAKPGTAEGKKKPGEGAGPPPGALFKTGLLGNTVVRLTARCYLLGKKDPF